MSTPVIDGIGIAGQPGWTRDLARDLFPGKTTPFAWTLLSGPADRALRNAYSELGGQGGNTSFWRLTGGYAYLKASAVSESDQTLCGAGWLGRNQPQAPGGLRGRLHAGGVTKRCQARLAAVTAEATGLQTRLSRWLAWVQGVKWTQADLLQVMEELEPHALAALQTYFLARVSLNVAGAAFEARVQEWLPASAPEVRAGLTLGTPGLPSVTMAASILEAARREPTDPERLTTLARCSHRGPGEIRPDALRWPDAPELLRSLAAQGEPRWTQTTAQAARERALAGVTRSLDSKLSRQLEGLQADLAVAMRTVDIAWDSLTLVMAAAQRWAGASAREALAAGLIARPADVLYLGLEELKQVATGEWHAGDRDEVQVAVAQRLREIADEPPVTPPRPVIVCPGSCDGPLYCDSPRNMLPPPGALWAAEAADPGCAPFWAFAGCVLGTGDDAWAPGMVALRGLGAPARLGAVPSGG